MAEPTKKLKYVNNSMYEYAIYPLIDNTSKVLKTNTPIFNFGSPPIDPRFITVSLIETMVKHQGLGLAAPQIGLSHRVFVMGHGSTAFGVFNPEIIEAIGELTPFTEGCLSYLGLYLKIKRPETVKVRYQDMNGETKEQTFTGLTARVFQHELDHLNGVVFVDKVHPLNLEKAKRKVKTNLKKLEKQRIEYERQQIIQQAANKVLTKQTQEQPSQNDKVVLSVPDKITLWTPNLDVTITK